MSASLPACVHSGHLTKAVHVVSDLSTKVLSFLQLEANERSWEGCGGGNGYWWIGVGVESLVGNLAP